MRGLNSSEIKSITGKREHNYLPKIIGLKWLFQLACVQSIPFNDINKNGTLKKYCVFASVKRENKPDISKICNIFKHFTEIKKVAKSAELTRTKLERITKTLIKDQQYAQEIGKNWSFLQDVQEQVKRLSYCQSLMICVQCKMQDV